jgi:aspartyl-tRNA(Asn)/glutamyl-tRNA(Gln) amidotransferase subunit A
MIPVIHYQAIGELHEQIRTGKISPVDVVDACLTRINRLNPTLNAFITVFDDDARELAKQAEAEIKAARWKGPLHGIPVGIKDFYDTAGSRTTAAFEHFRNRIPKKDAAGVAKLKAAGAIVVGKTNMHRLGMGTTGLESAFGPVRNPWDGNFIPGGSSSGSAAAIAAGLCYAALDTDAIGSCRLPAACCGVVGFKGTYGLISSQGILEGEKADETILWLAHPGITTRSVTDTAFVLNALAGHDGNGARQDFHVEALRETKLRVGVADNFNADQEITNAFTVAIESIRALGHAITTAHAPFDMPPFGDLHAIESDRKTIADRAFKVIDVMVLPTTVTTVPTVNDARANPQALSPQLTMFANYFGLPAISVPCGVDRHGLPLGLQIIGKPLGEAYVLQLARQYEAGSAQRHRPIP